MVASIASSRRRTSVFTSWVASAAPLSLLIGLSTASLWSQATSTSSVRGQVTDQTSAPVPGVRVTLTNPETSTQLATATNSDGRYVFSNVDVGTYTVTFEKQGFAVSKLGKQAVDVGTTLTVNTALQLGATSTNGRGASPGCG